MMVGVVAAVRALAAAEAAPPPAPAAELWDGWHTWAVVVTSPGVGFGEIAVTTDGYRRAVLGYDPDYIDWSAGATLNRAKYTSNRGVPAAAPQQFESDWAFAFPPDDPMQPYFRVNGHAINETGSAIVGSSEVTNQPAFRMCHNGPLWEHVQGQGMIRQVASTSHRR
jgi:hypothetical protein